jgi:hypothetical protein
MLEIIPTLDRVAFLYLYLLGGSAGVNVEERLGFKLNCWANKLIQLGSTGCGWLWKGGITQCKVQRLPAVKLRSHFITSQPPPIPLPPTNP